MPDDMAVERLRLELMRFGVEGYHDVERVVTQFRSSRSLTVEMKTLFLQKSPVYQSWMSVLDTWTA